MPLVDSEAIAEIDYDAPRRILRVRFVDGGWYRYLDVPPATHAAFVAAESHGRFFHAHILGRYAYRRER